MIGEAFVLAVSLLGCASCWAFVQKHRITAEMQKHKLNHDLEVLRPPPDPQIQPKPEKPSPLQQSLTELLNRRRNLEAHINQLRDRASEYRYSNREYTQFRADALKALSDAREEQKELVLEEAGLLEMMQSSIKDETKEQLQKRVADAEDQLEALDDLDVEAEKKEERE